MKDFLKGYVLHNAGLKLISLALAVGLWLAVSRDPKSEVAVDVPIEFHNIPADLEISSVNIPKAQIRLRGPSRIVRHLEPSQVYAEIEVGGVRPGDRTFDLTAQQIHPPSDIEVVQVFPNELHLTFDARLTRDVPVQPRVVGAAATGYQIDHIEVSPRTITITGPEKRVSAVESAITDPVDVTGAMNRVSFMRHPYVSDPVIQVTSSDPVRITVVMEKNQKP